MNKSLKFILGDARVQISAVLLLIWISAILKDHLWKTVVYPLYSILLFIIFDLGFTFIKTKKWYFPFSSIVSGLLIGFIIHYSQGIIIITSSVIIAFLSKHFLKIKHRHIFNPAAFGTVFSCLLFNSTISWWATASGGISLILILPAFFILYKSRRLQYTLTFLVGYFLFFALMQGPKTALSLTIDGTVFQFAFIMLTEPMTSNIGKFWKWGFGIVVLTGIIISYFLKISFTDPLLLSLLLINLLVRITSI